MTSFFTAVNRTLFQRHDYRPDAWFGLLLSAGVGLAAGMIVTVLIDEGIADWTLMPLPFVAVYLLHMSVMLACAAASCDPKTYEDKAPWMLGLIGNKKLKPTFLEQTVNWATPSGRDKLRLIANS